MKNNLYNMLANIKKGQIVNREFIIIERKKICESFLKILWNEGFIIGYEIYTTNKVEKLKIFLKYSNNKPSINAIKLISKPGKKIYYSIKQIWKLSSSKSFIVMSTSKGLKSILECKKLRIGGEPFAVIN